MARRLTDLTTATLPLDKSEIILVQQAGVDKQATVLNVLDVGYLSSDFDTDFAAKDTDGLTEGATNKYFFNHNNTQHTATFLVAADVVYAVLDANGDIGTSAGQVAIGNHHHDVVYIKIDGTTAMTGELSVPSIDINTVNPADTATIFGTDSAGDSTMHIRIGNGVGDKFQIESWNGASATSLLEVGQTDVTILGNLIVSGTTTTIESATLSITNNQVILNSDVTGVPAIDAALTVERGSSTDAKVYWQESSDTWNVDQGTGSLERIATYADFETGDGLDTFNTTPLSKTEITHGLGTASFTVSITPTSASGGFLGEYYVLDKTAAKFDVYKTGSAAGVKFDWIITKI